MSKRHTQLREVCERERPLKVYVTPSDREKIEERAKLTGLSVSSFLTRVGLNTPIRCMADHDVIDAVLRLNAEVTRVGAELKAWLTKRPGEGASPEDIWQTLQELHALQQQMMVTVSQLRRPGWR
ncbi:plasmid mobilization protein [Dyella acidiphila]|uniref:Conjugal transfer protein TraJ n=1 Tax=Dyella acidiphila TaxID=2775866 RepID=A0ABR9GFC7_9GAMM|nr:hypothetical protein [Dyella acidiphila]MBE1162751.1 hypothetical protein [Dyella acidiphila]